MHGRVSSPDPFRASVTQPKPRMWVVLPCRPADETGATGPWPAGPRVVVRVPGRSKDSTGLIGAEVWGGTGSWGISMPRAPFVVESWDRRSARFQLPAEAGRPAGWARASDGLRI